MLNLSPEDAAEYARRCNMNNLRKEVATNEGDKLTARKMRQANTALYQEYYDKQLPSPPPTAREREDDMTLEQRVNRIEMHLQLGIYHPDY